MAIFTKLSDLAAVLRQQAAATGQIDLTPSAFWQTDRVPKILQAELGRTDLRLVVSESAIDKDPVGALVIKSATTPANSTDTFLGLISKSVTISFTLEAPDNEVNFVLTVELGTDWRFATSYAALATDPVLNGLPFLAPQFVLDTRTTAAEPMVFSGGVDLGSTAGEGLSLVHQVFPGIPTSVSLSGPIEPGPAFDLRIQLLKTTPARLGGLIEIGPPYLGVRTIEVAKPGETKDSYPAGQWIVGTDVKLGGEADLTLALIPLPELGMFGLAILPDKPQGTELDVLVGALLNGIGGADFKNAFGDIGFVTDILNKILAAFAFKGMSAMFTVGTNTGLRYIAMSVGSADPDYKLPIIPGVLECKDFTVDWLITEPASSKDRATTVAISAELDFAQDYPFALSAVLPEFNVEAKYIGKPKTLTLTQLEDQLFHGHLSIPFEPSVTFNGFDLVANPPAGTFTLTVAAAADVTLFGTRILAISDATLSITRAYDTKMLANGGDGNPPVPKDSFAFDGIIAIGKLQFDVSARIGDGDNVFTIHMVDETLGGLITYLISLVDPYLELRLESPWDKLNTISLDALVLTINTTKGTVSVDYPVKLDLGFVSIDSIGLQYERAGKNPDGTPKSSSLQLDVACTFLGIKYGGSDSSKPPLGWNPVTDRAPAVPGGGAALLDLQYLALGQHVTVTGGDLTTIAKIFDTLRGKMVPLDSGSATPEGLPGVEFSADSQWLIAAQFTVMGTVSISGVFNDPVLAGIRIALSGSKAGSFAGLEFEILYTRVTPTIGLYHSELKLPDAMRHLEFGEVSVTLPVVTLDIYTNGNFRIDLGFPQGLDFSRSFSIQVFPFVGYGGFYFALLNGQTSKRVPQITNGQFSPVIEFGVGLSLGVGKTINEGVFSAGASVTVVGIVEGVIGWFEPASSAVKSDRYYWIQGTVAIVGKVYGSVDFAIISVDVQITAYASVTLTIEAYQPIQISLYAEVSVQASVKILFVRIHFSFSLSLDLAWTIGSASTPPWQVAAGGGTGEGATLQAQDAHRPLLLPVHGARAATRREWLRLAAPASLLATEPDWTPRSVGHLLAGNVPGKQPLDIVVTPAFTLGDDGKTVQCVLLTFVGNSIRPEAHSVAEAQVVAPGAADAPFNQFAVRLLAWAVAALGPHIDGPEAIVTADDLAAVAKQLYDPAVEQGPLSYSNLHAFLGANFDVRLLGRTPGTSAELSGTLFPILPDLGLAVCGETVADFSDHTPVDANYQKTIDTYLQQLAVAYQTAAEKEQDRGATAQDRAAARLVADNGAPPSMAQVVFGNYCTMLARAGANAAVRLLRSYPYTVPAGSPTPSLNTIAASFPAAQGHYTSALGDTLGLLAVRYSTTTAELKTLNPALASLGDDDPIPVGTQILVPIVVTTASVVAANLASTGLLTGSTVTIAGVQYQARAQDSFTSIATAMLAASPGIQTPVEQLAASLMTANLLSPALQPGAQIAIDTSKVPLQYTVQPHDTLETVAAVYTVRTGGAGTLNLITGLSQLVTEIIALNPKPGGGSYGPTEAIPDKTILKVPSGLAPGGTRVAQMGDTPTRIAGMLLAPGTASVPLSPMVSALAQANGISSPNPFAELTQATLTVPPLTAVIQPGDTLTWIATSFGISDPAALGTLILDVPGELSIGAVLQVPDLPYEPVSTDTLGGIAQRFNLTVDDLASAVGPVAGALTAGAVLTIPQVPALALGQIQSDLLAGGSLNTTAAMVSRFMLHGLRLPTPPHAGTLAGDALSSVDTAALYGLVGQQFALPASLPSDFDFTLGDASGTAALYMGGYTVRAGDSLASVVSRFAPAGEQSAFSAALAQLNAPADLSSLQPGQELIFPGAESYVTVSGDSVDAVATRFAAAGMQSLLVAALTMANPGVDFTKPGTEIVLPVADSATTLAGATLSTVAGQFVTSEAVAAYTSQLQLLNPDVPVTGPIQPGTVLLLPALVLRLPVSVLEMSFSADESQVIAALAGASFNPAPTIGQLPLFRDVPARDSLTRMLHWQCAALPSIARFKSQEPAAGEPTIWAFPASLQERLEQHGEPEPAYELASVQAGAPTDRATPTPVPTYAWGTIVDVGIRQVGAADGPLANRYLLTGANDSGRAQLELLWSYLNGPGSSASASAFLLYPPNPAGSNPSGLVSDALDPQSTFLVQTNLSSVSSSGGPTAPTAREGLNANGVQSGPPTHSAGIANVKDLVRLLFEGSVVHAGGYYLAYASATGGDLPGHLFANGPEATLTLLVLVDDGVLAPSPPPIHAAHNCAVVLTNLDPSTSDVFVEPVIEVADDSQNEVRPGTVVPSAPGQLQRVTTAPAGTAGFEVTRPDPGPASATTDVDDLFQLLAYAIQPAGGFRASPEGLPAGPARSADDATDGYVARDIATNGSPPWMYKKLLPVARFAADALGADPPEGAVWTLPSPWEDPYRGIAPGSQATISFSFRDVYGNVGVPAQAIADLSVPVGYFDDLLGIDQWPSVAIAYEVVPGTPPGLLITATFDAAHYVAGPGLSRDAAVRNAAARQGRMEQAWFQLRQPDVSAVLRSSLDQPSATGGDPLPPPTPYPVAKRPLVALVGSAWCFLGAAQSLAAYTHQVGSGQTLAALADQYTVSVGDLATANAGVKAQPLFQAPELQIPVFYHYAFGDTLGQTGVTADELQAASLDLPLNEGTDLSLASQPQVWTLSDGDTLRHVCSRTSSAAAAVAQANPGHPLTPKVPITVGGVTLAAGDSDSLATMVNRFGDAGIVTTAAKIGAANQDTPNLFDRTRQPTLTVNDRVIAAGDTLRSVTTGPPALSLELLVSDNAHTADVFPTGTALWESNQPYTMQPDDTLGGIAERFGIDLATLVTATGNGQAKLEAGTLTVPGQVTFGRNGAPQSVHVLGSTETLSGVASAYGRTITVAGLIALNRWTQDLFATGSLNLGSVQVPVAATDTFDTLFAAARAKGFTGAFVPDFVDAAAADLGAGSPVLAPGALLTCPPMTVGVGTGSAVAETLDQIALKYGYDSALALVQANGALRGLLRPGATVSYPAGEPHPAVVTLMEDDTLLTLAAKVTIQGFPVSLEGLARHAEFTDADMLAVGAGLVPAAFGVTETIPFTATPQNPNAIFAVDVTVELSRSAALVDPDFKDVSPVLLAASRVAPQQQGTADNTDPTLSLHDFAVSFEKTFPGLKAAVSRWETSDGSGANGQLWAVDLRAGTIAFDIIKGSDPSPNPNASYFALPPLSTDLMSKTVEVKAYTSGQPLGQKAPQVFRSVDLDAWASRFLSAVDAFLSPEYATAARELDPALVDKILGHKQSIAHHLSKKVEAIFDEGPAGDLNAAEQELEQQMLASLGSAYTISTIVQLPVDVTASPFTDSDTAPRLAGAPVVTAGSGGFSLSTAKVPLSKGQVPLTFAVSVEQPVLDRVLDVTLRYDVNEVEHAIKHVTGITDYQDSSWLSLLIPIDAAAAPDLAKDTDIGRLSVPVPLRACPQPPAMIAQSATATPASEPLPPPPPPSDLARELAKLRRWDYSFTFTHPSTDQDTRYLTVTLNGPPPAGAQRGPTTRDTERLFDALAQFTAVYTALAPDLSILLQLAPGSSSPVAENAISVFEALVGGVAEALTPEPALEIEDHDSGLTVAYRVNVDSQASPPTMTLTRSSTVEGVDWPDIYGGVKDEAHRLASGKCGPTDPTCVYTYPETVPPSEQTYVLVHSSLDVTKLQSAVAAAWVVRNQDLGGGRTVNHDFVYQTAVAEFSSAVVPLLVHEERVAIRSDGEPVAAALDAVLTDLFGDPSTGWAAQIKLAAGYGYGVGAAAELTASLPILVITRHDLAAADAATFAASIDALLATWLERIAPAGATDAGFVFDLTLFAAHATGAEQPVLDLHDLVFTL